jgi:hypothetical protein
MFFDQQVVLPFSLDLHQAHIPNFVSYRFCRIRANLTSYLHIVDKDLASAAYV